VCGSGRGRSFALLSGVLAAAGIAALQVDMPGLRILHVVRGLLLISFVVPARVAAGTAIR
jgi:hypothetical protein